MDEIMKIPPVTRTILGGVLITTLPIMLKLVSAYTILFSIPKLQKFELWRLATPFLYGGEGIAFIFDVFLLFRNSSGLEEGHFFNRTAGEHHTLEFIQFTDSLLQIMVSADR